MQPVTVLRTLAEAESPICERERTQAYDAARSITVLALLDALEDPAGQSATAEAARGLLVGASADRLTVLLEPVHARQAHVIIETLVRAGLIDGTVARVVHARLDARRDPHSAL